MKKLLFHCAFLISLTATFAQNPAILWQKTIGGNAGDYSVAFEPTSDGGYIMGGYSSSNASGDKTENSNGGTDIWIVKINATGNIQWQNTIGGSGEDFLLSIKQTTDGGYILGASSDSNISGDKTENSRGGLDYWIIKLNSTGSITWQKTYGGNQPDFEVFVVQTTDGGYFAGGYSDSNISGDKTDPSNGQRDFWALKLDTTGNIVWQNSIGGALVDRAAAVSFQTADGGFLMCGQSTSNSGGDKTENSRGGNDYWIVKLGANGTVLWDKTIGGSGADILRDVVQTTDGGFLLGGYSTSNVSGDKTENSRGDFDYWILKLNSTGNLVWQKTIGGSGVDYPRDVKQLADGNFMIAGWSNSNISGDKTVISQGGYDFWLVKLDTNGNIISQNSIGGSADESGTYVIENADGNFTLFCSSDSNISGDKSENNKGLDDFWVFKTTPAILGMTKNTFALNVSLYPNPTKGNFSINLGESYSKSKVTLTNLLGQEITVANFENKQILEMNIVAVPGIYLATVTNNEGKSATFKILIKS